MRRFHHSVQPAANSTHTVATGPSLNEPRPPPPYQHASGATCASRSRWQPGGARRASPPGGSDSLRRSSGSVDLEGESFLTKGCEEEDLPSDSTAVLGPEVRSQLGSFFSALLLFLFLFFSFVPQDGSGLQLPSAYEPEPLGKYGTLDVAFEYDSSEQYLAVTVTAATDIPALKQTGNIAWQVHLVLLPTKKQRAKTGVQKGPCPVFTETFKFSRVEQEALGDYAVRFRLYSIRRMKKEKVLGEKVFYLTKLNLQGKMALPVTLEPGSELAVSEWPSTPFGGVGGVRQAELVFHSLVKHPSPQGCGSLVSVSRSAGALSYRSSEDTSLPEILLGLVYNSATGQLSAEVIKGSYFKTAVSDKPVST